MNITNVLRARGVGVGKKLVGDAQPAHVLNSKTFSNADGNDKVGTMPNRGGIVLLPGAADVAIPDGYHSGTGKVNGDANLVAGNIRSGVPIFGVNGNILEADGNAADGDVLTGKSFSRAGAVGRNGSMSNRTGYVTAQSRTVSGTTLRLRPYAGYYPGDAANAVQDTDANWAPENIKNGVSIFGKVGSFVSPIITNLRMGLITIAADTAIKDTAITSVDRNRSIIMMSYSGSFGSIVSGAIPAVDLTSNTNIRAQRFTAVAEVTTIRFIVIEFANVKSIQRGQTQVYGTNTDIPITAVTLAKAIPFCSFRYDQYQDSYHLLDTYLQYYLATTTALRIEVAGRADRYKMIYWQVVEFD